MAAINWSERFSVGVQQLDQQHKHLFELVNQLSDAMKSGKKPEVVGQIFVDLIKYTDNHFKTEEELFSKYRFGGSLSHKKHHDELRSKAMELKTKHDNGSIVVTVELLNFLASWINNHILEEDMQYKEFLIKNGVR